MPAVKKSIPNLINGVSQQPPALRFPTQCTEQVNAYANVVDGLKKRPPTQHLARLLDDPNTDAYIHTINRDRKERYVVLIANNDLKVFDFKGTERTVNFPNGKGYLATPSPSTAFAATTVADYSFIVNKEMNVRVQDPFADINLVPVYEKRWVISFNRVPPNSVSYDFSMSSEYACYVEGAHVFESVASKEVNWGSHGRCWINKSFYDEPSLQNYMSKVADTITRVYGWPVEIIGQDLHVKTQTMGLLRDASLEKSVTKTSHHSHWHVGCSSKPYSTISKSEMKNVLVRYESPNGDVIPPRAVIKQEALFFVKSADYSVTYTIGINDKVFAYTTSDTERSTISTEFIASELKKKMDADSVITAGFDLFIDGSVLLVRSKDNTVDFKATARDSMGDSHIIAVKDKVQQISDLPKRGFRGFSCAVVGSGSVDERYYVTYDEGENNTETGAWLESAAKGLNNELVASTMPHQLVSESDGSFTFRHAVWAKRHAGDEETNAEPSFVNRQINDVFFYQNRLGVLAGENMVLSEDGEYWNFYPTTVRTVLDSAPIDIGATSDRVSILRHAVSFNERLLLFADNIQFAVKYDQTLTAASVALDVTTRFEALLKAKPVGAGQNVFFAVNLGNFSGLREYYVAPDTQVNNAADITAHVPSYIKGEVSHLAASPSQDIIVVRTGDDKRIVYVYTYYWEGNEKVQSAWSRWTFDGDVMAMEFIESKLYLILGRPEGLTLETIDLSRFNEPVSNGWPTEIYLDRRELIRKGENKPGHLSSTTLGITSEGKVWENLDSLYANGVSLKDHYLGTQYRFEYTFSPQTMSTRNDKVVDLADRLQLYRMAVSYADTGYFDAVVAPLGRQASIYTFTGLVTGSLSNILGKANLETATFKFPIMSNARTVDIKLQSDSHLPCSFQTAEWRGLINPKAQRVS